MLHLLANVDSNQRLLPPCDLDVTKYIAGSKDVIITDWETYPKLRLPYEVAVVAITSDKSIPEQKRPPNVNAIPSVFHSIAHAIAAFNDESDKVPKTSEHPFHVEHFGVIGGYDLIVEAMQLKFETITIVHQSIAGGTTRFPYHLLEPLRFSRYWDRYVHGQSSLFIEDKEGIGKEVIRIDLSHPELQYLSLMKEALIHGSQRMDRTGTGTRAIFGHRLQFDLREGFPLLTTKEVWFNGIVKELLFFISGKTDTLLLEKQGVKIWHDNTTEEFLQKRGLNYRAGDMGPSYSLQWRHAGVNYEGCDKDYTGQGIDQLQQIIDNIKNKPYDRRHLVSAWSVSDIDKMALPPCHCLAQFFVDNDPVTNTPKYLDCTMYQRSADLFLGVPFNIASYALLLTLIATVTGLTPRRFIHELGDAHIYLNHLDQVRVQISRTPLPFPKVTIKRPITSIDEVSFEDIVLEGYKSHGKLSGSMAV